MSQRTRVILGVAILVVLVGALIWIRSSSATPAGRLAVAGDVRADIRTISAPVITYPTPDYTVGITATGYATGATSAGKSLAGAPLPTTGSSAGGSSSAAKRSAAAAASASRTPAVAGMLTTVTVSEGDTVKAGEVVARFDTTLLKLGVEQAEAASRKQHKDVAVLGKTIDKLITAQGKIATGRAKIATGKAAALKGQAALLKAKTGALKGRTALLAARKLALANQKKLLEAKAQRPQLEAALAALEAQAATFPPGKVPPALAKKIANLKALLASIDPGLKGIAKGLKVIDTNLKTIATGLKTINTNLAKIATGLASMPTAIATINTAAKQIADAKVTLRDAKDVLGIVAKGSSVGIKLANARLGFAEVRTPVGGVVTFARQGGTVALVGAPLVRVQTDGPELIDTYLTADQIAIVPMGSAADVTYDSAPGTVVHGTVVTIGSTYLYPPTSFPTAVVHMTRTLQVTISVDKGSSIPEGTPVDISIKTTAKN